MKYFTPESLPLKTLDWMRIIEFIGETNAVVAGFDALLQKIPNPEIFLAPLEVAEATASSRIGFRKAKV